MIVNAKAYLYYSKGDAISSGWERLELNVYFREKGKLLSTYLAEDLVSTFNVARADRCDPEDRIDSYEEYYQKVNEAIENTEHLKEVATRMVQDYFKDKTEEFDRKRSKKEIASKVRKMPKINVSIEIK